MKRLFTLFFVSAVCFNAFRVLYVGGTADHESYGANTPSYIPAKVTLTLPEGASQGAVSKPSDKEVKVSIR